MPQKGPHGLGQPQLLKRYVIDRCQFVTNVGPIEGVVLSITTHEGGERTVAMSKEDAMVIADQLRLAAFDAKALVDGKLGLKS